MFNSSYGTTVIMVAMVALICISIQKFFKKYLESDQYYYLKDITLVGAWAVSYTHLDVYKRQTHCLRCATRRERRRCA